MFPGVGTAKSILSLLYYCDCTLRIWADTLIVGDGGRVERPHFDGNSGPSCIVRAEIRKAASQLHLLTQELGRSFYSVCR